MRFEENEHEKDISHHYIPLKSLAFDSDKAGDWDLIDNPPCVAIEVQSSLHGRLPTIQEKCRLYGLDRPVNAWSVFSIDLSGL